MGFESRVCACAEPSKPSGSHQSHAHFRCLLVCDSTRVIRVICRIDYVLDSILPMSFSADWVEPLWILLGFSSAGSSWLSDFCWRLANCAMNRIPLKSKSIPKDSEPWKNKTHQANPHLMPWLKPQRRQNLWANSLPPGHPALSSLLNV
ncbi:hypothetical protein RRG08_000485 [Elysia crispata]|uniref:Uncharacterized protein n=1 Tax=Elysia crispata TaxID=231223 RepID=A0AAE1CWB6_9GAST|nr:hypothetical protein RRG08_000485 [Elysia crispata]